MIGLFEILIFIAVIVYGYTKPAEEETGSILKSGFIYGLVLGALIGIFQSENFKIFRGEIPSCSS